MVGWGGMMHGMVGYGMVDHGMVDHRVVDRVVDDAVSQCVVDKWGRRSGGQAQEASKHDSLKCYNFKLLLSTFTESREFLMHPHCSIYLHFCFILGACDD
jgi:hypothetical protein